MERRTRGRRGMVVVSQTLADGWVVHPQLDWAITTVRGPYYGLPMRANSAVAIALGYPGPVQDIPPPPKCPIPARCIFYLPHSHCENCTLFITPGTRVKCDRCGHAVLVVLPNFNARAEPLIELPKINHVIRSKPDAG